MSMSGNFTKLALENEPVLAAKAVELYKPDIEFYKTHIAGMEEVMVSQSIDPGNLRRLLDCLVNEDCIHSWRNFASDGTLDGLLQWENRLRPTKLFFFYVEHHGEMTMIAAAAVAEKIARDFPYPGFCVLGRCYIMPEFRSHGFYRHILRYRLEYCKAQFGGALKAVHIGSINERVSRVISNHRLDSWSKFIHLGEEELRVAGHIRAVGAYMLLVPEYVHKIQSALAGAHAPPCVVELRDALSRIESGDMSNLGMLIKEPFEKACKHGWFNEPGSLEIEQLLQFCSSIPLVGFNSNY